MKTKHLVLTFVGLVASWTIDTQFNTSYSNESGAPSAVTGSPGDGNKTCAKSGCHTGFAVVNVPNLITSNIPPSGYVPGTTYTITSTCSQPGISRWGFEISPQDNSGNMLEQIIIETEIGNALQNIFCKVMVNTVYLLFSKTSGEIFFEYFSGLGIHAKRFFNDDS